MNAPESFHMFLLAAGEKKIEYSKDTKVTNAGTFKIKKEDHTVGNMLTTLLHHDPRVLFAGYKFPHPLEDHILLRIRTTPDYSPHKALQVAIKGAIQEVLLIQQGFKDEIARVKRSQDGAQTATYY